MGIEVREQRLSLTTSAGELDATWLLPERATAALVLAHGAGADHRHANMAHIAEALAQQHIATLRFNFPFMQAGRRRVDAQPVAVQVIVDVLAYAREHTPLPLFAGGHSFGGRMTSHAAVQHSLPIQGLIFCAFPLHGPKKPATERASHLVAVGEPMLFLSGTRDDLAEQALLTSVVAELPGAELHWLATANHSYTILKRQRAPEPTVFEEMAAHASAFVQQFS